MNFTYALLICLSFISLHVSGMGTKKKKDGAPLFIEVNNPVETFEKLRSQILSLRSLVTNLETQNEKLCQELEKQRRKSLNRTEKSEDTKNIFQRIWQKMGAQTSKEFTEDDEDELYGVALALGGSGLLSMVLLRLFA